MDEKPPNLDGELTHRVIKLMSTVNVAVYKLTRGRAGGTWRIGAGWRTPCRSAWWSTVVVGRQAAHHPRLPARP